ncbi:YqzM family protein [Rubeoparvulum massiliense]|nr:YqzM family protein [Rubeoparvulum massiliense]
MKIENPSENSHPQQHDVVDSLVGFLGSFGLFALMALVAGILSAFK